MRSFTINLHDNTVERLSLIAKTKGTSIEHIISLLTHEAIWSFMDDISRNDGATVLLQGINTEMALDAQYPTTSTKR